MTLKASCLGLEWPFAWPFAQNACAVQLVNFTQILYSDERFIAMTDMTSWLAGEANKRFIIEMIASDLDPTVMSKYSTILATYFNKTRNFGIGNAKQSDALNAYKAMQKATDDYVSAFMGMINFPDFKTIRSRLYPLLGCCPDSESRLKTFLTSQIQDLIAVAESQINIPNSYGGPSLPALSTSDFYVLVMECYGFPAGTIGFYRRLPRGLNLFCLIPGHIYDPIQRKIKIMDANGDGVWESGLKPGDQSLIPSNRYDSTKWTEGQTDPVFHTRHLLFKILDPLLKIGETLAFAGGTMGIFAAAGLQTADMSLRGSRDVGSGLSEMSQLATTLKENDIAVLLARAESQWTTGLDFLIETYDTLQTYTDPLRSPPDSNWLQQKLDMLSSLATNAPTTDLANTIELLIQPDVCLYGYGHFLSLVTLEFMNMVTFVTLNAIAGEATTTYIRNFALHMSTRINEVWGVIWTVLQGHQKSTWCRHSKNGHKDVRTFASPEDGRWYWGDSGWSEGVVGLITDGWNRNVGGTLRAARTDLTKAFNLISNWETLRGFWASTVPIVNAPDATAMKAYAFQWWENLPQSGDWIAGNKVRYGIQYLNDNTITTDNSTIGWMDWEPLTYYANPMLIWIPVDNLGRAKNRRLYREFQKPGSTTPIHQTVLSVFDDNTTTTYVDLAP